MLLFCSWARLTQTGSGLGAKITAFFMNKLFRYRFEMHSFGKCICKKRYRCAKIRYFRFRSFDMVRRLVYRPEIPVVEQQASHEMVRVVFYMFNSPCDLSG